MGMGSGSFELTGVFVQITGPSLLFIHYCEAAQGRQGSSCHTAMLLPTSRIKLIISSAHLGQGWRLGLGASQVKPGAGIWMEG